ncbi:hypothetical protein [Burkholderia gladioli]|uniref:hypothetical protein n=1 Tax=Burkholderia gladioli TaxID=28095 RepID=UPI001640D490|nr:hypothetical protein [Burkholderia gladioli]
MKSPHAVDAAPARRVDGIVFEIALAIGLRVEVIGVPFMYRDRTFAVHPSTRSRVPTRVEYAVSDVETGRRIPTVAAATIDDARAAAMVVLDAVTEADWRKQFGASTRRKTVQA